MSLGELGAVRSQDQRCVDQYGDVVSESVVSVVDGDDSEVDPSVVEVLVSNRAFTVVLAVSVIQHVPVP